jgi:hypothetical protein
MVYLITRELADLTLLTVSYLLRGDTPPPTRAGCYRAGGWRLEAGGWRLEAGGWRLEAGGWRLEVEGGGWRLEASLPRLGYDTVSTCSMTNT